MPFVFGFAPVLYLFLGSQIYFLWRAARWGARLIHGRLARGAAGIAFLAAYAGFFAAGVSREQHVPNPIHMNPADALLLAPFLWWIFSSTVAFLVVTILWLMRELGRAAKWATRSMRPRPSLETSGDRSNRRQFLESAGTAAVAAPFIAGAYGLLYGRLNLETTHQQIHLSRLPKVFDGFRIVQLSDVHIGPFMGEDEIRKYVRIANSLKPDLVALTGDYVIFDPSVCSAVVNALSGLRAPYGVFGCLGNHDAWTESEDELTDLFHRAGFRMLRQQNVPIQASGESFNLIGIDFASSRGMSAGTGHMSSRRLEGMERLLAPHTANVLLSHNPETFPRAAQMGIDFSLAGHTHGGQLALEFISPELAPSRLMTRFVAGWFQKPGGQLYVNRGIGTIAAPMRIGAPPEITVYQLVSGSPQVSASTPGFANLAADAGAHNLFRPLVS